MLYELKTIILYKRRYLKYQGTYLDTCGGYHQYCGGCSVPPRFSCFQYYEELSWYMYGEYSAPQIYHDIAPHYSRYTVLRTHYME